MHHIHVYFTAHNKDNALALRDLLRQSFPGIRLGRVHDKPVGPHPSGSFEIDVSASKYAALHAFLEQHSFGLTMMIHPVTGDDIADHAEDKIEWINKPVPINRQFFRPSP